jgi:hypothetical protein
MILPTLPDGVAQAVARISIRGRMALGARCFDDVCAHFGIAAPEVRALSDYFWSYTDAEDLGAWESDFPLAASDAWELMVVVADPSKTLGAGWDQTPDPIGQVLPVFLGLPLVVVTMMVIIFDDIGRGNLYSGVVDHSPATRDATLRVLACVQQLGLPLPDLAPFLRSPFTEANGWGEPRPREFFTA